jgi:FKBP-type peptidyl-prolyl cis-trans isomerase FkpA
MKYSMLFFILTFICKHAISQNNVSKIPDSISASGFYTEIKITESRKSKKNIAGLAVNKAIISLGYNGDQKTVQFHFTDKTKNYLAFGKDVYQLNNGNAWNYSWKENENYPLLIVTASDSATNKTLYSGYIFLPDEKKWKLIATNSYDDTTAVKYIGNSIDKKSATTFSNRWLLRNDGTWKAMDSQTNKPPVLRPMSSIDSLTQQQTEEAILRSKLPKGSVTYEEGIFYQSIKEGTGKMVKVTDTVTVHYKGWLFNDGNVFDETKEKPATFPLNRLIQGWQTGVSHCKVGGKIRLYIPSGIAYGIRTRAADIPPNSILVFDIEVLDAKEKIK